MPGSSDRKHPLTGYGLALLAAACWATGGLTAKWLFTAPGPATAAWPLPPLGISIDPTVLSGGRALSAFVLLFAFLAVRRRDLLIISRRDIWFFAAFGVAGLAMVHYTYFKAISLTSVSTAILLQYLAPILVLGVGVAFMGHRLTWSLPVGVVLSVVGSALVVGAIGGDGLVVSGPGIAWGLAAAGFFATYSLMGGVAARRFAPYTTLVYGLGFAAAFWLVVLGPIRVLSVMTDPRSAAAVLFMAVFSTIIPFGAFLTALRHIAPANATIASTVEPVLAALGAWLLLGEPISAPKLLGGGLVIAAIIVVQLAEREVVPAFPPPD